ncbi:hypothetical protein [uncultured Shewanella sp.]|uniref:hypothetical protein n=1 Tax=uncultured Shewanella sp. TaxID=173975 RepID=UPI002625DC4A|nr:hypothetical protein [uncultured Shewanella sp.]
MAIDEEQKLWLHSSVSRSNNKFFGITLVSIGCVIVFLYQYLDSFSSTSTSTSTSQVVLKNLPDRCKDNMNALTLYDKSRLQLSRQTNQSVYINYLNNLGNTHHFKFEDDKVLLFGKGSGIWMEM